MSKATATCRIYDEWIKCGNPAWVGDPEGFCILHSQDKGKDPEPFKEVLRSRWQQEDAEFYDFRRVFFPGPFDPEEFFDSRQFTKPADFTGAIFMEANFRNATFSNEANFTGASFTEEADFYGATFAQESNFLTANFEKEANFQKAKFRL